MPNPTGNSKSEAKINDPSFEMNLGRPRWAEGHSQFPNPNFDNIGFLTYVSDAEAFAHYSSSPQANRQPPDSHFS
jgi:hypothetical protein